MITINKIYGVSILLLTHLSYLQIIQINCTTWEIEHSSDLQSKKYHEKTKSIENI